MYGTVERTPTPSIQGKLVSNLKLFLLCMFVCPYVCVRMRQWILWIYFYKIQHNAYVRMYMNYVRTYARMYVSVVFCTIALYHVNTSLASNAVLTQSV